MIKLINHQDQDKEADCLEGGNKDLPLLVKILEIINNEDEDGKEINRTCQSPSPALLD